MESQDVIVLRKLHEWRAAGRQTLLVTVVRTWGSSPRPPGSLMALNDEGTVIGSVSGGCIEDDLIRDHIAGQRLAQGPHTPRLLTYGVTADEARRFGLPCGGTIELALEYNPDLPALEKILAALEDRRLVIRSTHLGDGHVIIRPTDRPHAVQREGDWLHVGFGPAYRMLIIGAGQLAEYLATMALFNGFDVTVCDPRIEHRRAWSVTGAKVVTGMPDDEVIAMAPDRHTCIVALSHDPKIDDMGLLEALASDAFYVGAIGSRRNARARRERMIDYLEQTPATMDRLRSPVGMDIGSKTPAEIAVSIMAEVIATKNGVQPSSERLAERAQTQPSAIASD